ncbi:MAG: hypothetical protein KW793_04580 [Candidatus Doudnabacteria bacterium]|nr:hypothetical protein [Candidatus Doudnabacteria bacterium]
MRKKYKINKPFDVTYNISFSGRTKADGIQTVTAQIIRDKIVYLLEDMIAEGHIRDYTISATLNNIEESKRVLKKSRRK